MQLVLIAKIKPCSDKLHGKKVNSNLVKTLSLLILPALTWLKAMQL